MFKNVASQKLTVLAFADAGHATLDAGDRVTGDAANITLKIEQDDDGTQSASNDANPTEVEDGQYRFDLTQAETNGDKLTFYPESSTAGVQVVALPSIVIYTRPPNFAALGIETDGDLTKVNTLNGHTAQTGDSFARIGATGSGLTSLAQASVATEARLAELDAANIPADIDSLLLDTRVTLNGTAAAGSLTTITLTGGVATDKYYDGQLVVITGGTGIGQSRTILKYVGSTNVATVTRDWSTAPDGTSTFVVVANDIPAILEAGTAQAGAASNITLDAGASAITQTYNSAFIMITGGTGTGQTRLINNYVGTTKVASVTPPWTTNPDSTSVYQIVPSGRANIGQWLGTTVTGDGDWAELQTDVDAILVDTNELQTDWTDGGRLDLIVDELTTQGDANETKLDTIDGVADAILVDTNELQTDDVPGLIAALNDLSAAQVNAEVDTALSDIGLDHLVSAAVIGTDVADNSIVAKLVSSSATADWDDFVNTTDSLQSLRDHVGDGTSLTEAGGTGDHLSALPWNAAWDTEVESECTDALTAYNAMATTDLPSNFVDLSITATTGRVDVGSWLGTAVTTSSTTAKPEVDTFSVDDSEPAATKLKQSCLALQVITVQTAEASANTNTVFDTDLPLENDDYYGSADGGLVVAFVGGAAQQYQTRRIVASSTGTSNTRITLEEALDGVPSDSDVLVVLGRISELT